MAFGRVLRAGAGRRRGPHAHGRRPPGPQPRRRGGGGLPGGGTAAAGRRRRAQRLGNALTAAGRLDEAGDAYREAARLRPDWSAPVYNRGVALQGQGRPAESRAAFEAALRLNPADHVAHSTYVGSLLFDPDADGERLLAEGRRWAERARRSRRGRSRTATPPTQAGGCGWATSRRTSAPTPSPSSWGRCWPQHDPDAVEVFCYADVAAPDETTERLRGLGHPWRMTWGLSDDELEALVRRDGIDVLVDLCGHLAHNRPARVRPQADAGAGELAGLPGHHRRARRRLPADGRRLRPARRVELL